MNLRDLVLALVLIYTANATGANEAWTSKRLHSAFHAEGASVGDLDGDGVMDLVEGPLWYRGPEFTESFELAPVHSFPVAAYSDQFFSHVADVNSDNAADVIVIGFPGAPARLYVNPGHDRVTRRDVANHWSVFEITASVDNESPTIVDFIPGGLPEIVCGHDSQYGYYHAGDDPTKPWAWTAISRPGSCPHRFVHAMGVGDVNGDGHLDLIDRTFWWQHPSDPTADSLWQQHQWAVEPYGDGGAQICVDDIDGDGDNDLVSSLNAHGYGLAWFEQTADGQFQRHSIMGRSSTDNPFGVTFSQLHAVALVDIDGDGAKDIVTGRRHFAHGGKDSGGLQQAVLYWFRRTSNADAIEFVPHLIDTDSGVGVDILVADVNGDAKPDIVSSSKRGLTVHLQNSDMHNVADNGRAERWQISEGRDQSLYGEGFSPQEAAAKMLVPAGFSVDLIASEPELTQPIAMCFDARGRIWVIEGHTYPNKAPEGQGKDRIVIFEDSDANGSFEKKTLFAEGLNLASGIEVGFGGVFVGAAPELLFIADANHDDRPDAAPVVLLDGWGFHDTHETLNSLTWGPDGWLYGCQGVFTHSRVGAPGTPDDQRVPINAGVWRYHPVKQSFEVFAHGTSNPWGVDFNDNGDWFVSACVIPHLFHMIQGGRYERQAGGHFDPYTYEDIKTIADHAHYTGDIREHAFWGENKTIRPASGLDTSMLGGGHAHCGLAIYNGGVFPPTYDGSLLFHNLHGHRVVRESVEPDGTGYVGRHRPDFALAQDHNEIGVGVMVGPDGAIYTSDWHDPQTCHNRESEVWNRTDGRLFRVRYGDVQPYQFNLWQESDQQLIGRLKSDNGFFARQAIRILQERAAGLTDGVQSDLTNLDHAITQSLNQSSLTRDRLRSLWAMHAIGKTLEHADDLVQHSDPFVRAWSIQLIGEASHGKLSASVHQHFVRLAQEDNDLVVARYLASLLQRLPLEQRLPIAVGLASKSFAAHDHNLPLLVWYGIEPLVEQSPERMLDLASDSQLDHLMRFVVRRLAESASGRSLLVTRLADVNHRGNWLLVLEELSAAATARGGVEMPSQWASAFKLTTESDNPRVRELARSVAVRFGDAEVFPYFRSILVDPTRSTASRTEAIAALRTAKDPELAENLLAVLDQPQIAPTAVAALAEFEHPRTAEVLLSMFHRFDSVTKTNALATLMSRRSFAETLVHAMETQRVDPSEVPAFIIRQALSLNEDAITARLEKVWGRISVSSAEMKSQYEKYRNQLKPNVVASADASNGRALFDANCGKCHKLFGTGGDIGPDVTGANRSSVDYWLENIIEPNALIGRAYQMTTFLMADGRVVNGIVKSQNDDAVTVQTATEVVVLPKTDVEEERSSAVSLMPAGQLETMAPKQVQDLFKYLTGPGQVPLPGAN